MTTAQLIEKLQRCPRDAQVFVSDSESGHDRDLDVYLVDAWLSEGYPGDREVVYTDDRRVRTHGANCKAVVISQWGEEGELL